jgi:hypothetical protein
MMKANLFHSAFLTFALLFPISSHLPQAFAEEKGSTLEVPRAASAIGIDGVMGEAAWDNALELELRYEVYPAENTPAQVRTLVKVIYDGGSVYFGFRCFDPEPSRIRAHFYERDRAWRDDRVGVMLDTFNDERRSVFFYVNPYSVQMDFINYSGTDDIGWDAIWDAACSIDDQGWTAEIAVPFNALIFQRISGSQIWGFDALRMYPRGVEHWFSTIPDDRNNNNRLSEINKIRGFAGISPGRKIEITPTLTASRTDARPDPSAELGKRDQNSDLGLTARWGVTPNLTLIGTVNPDFSQVEADALQLDINQPFALFFEERRPFFTEGADFFSTRLNAVYTRMMRDPAWGFKFSGKEGSNTLGAYVVRDEITNLVFPSSQKSQTTTLQSSSTASVFRYKRDFGKRYTLGLLATDREGQDYFNRLFGFDGDLRVTDRDRVSLQFLVSSTRYPIYVADDFSQERGGFGDHALDIFYAHNSRTFDWWGGYSDVGRGFRADLGFMPQADYRNYLAGCGRNWIAPPGTWWSWMDLNAQYSRSEDQDGSLLQEAFSVYLNFNGAKQSILSPVISRSTEVYNGVGFELTDFSIWGQFRPVADVEISLGVNCGDQIDYANTRSGGKLRLLPSLYCNIGRRLSLGVEHVYERMTVDSGGLYTANISRFSGVYQFNIRAFFRATVQYVDYRYDPALYTFPIDPLYKRLTSQLLFAYKINPWTVLYLGYGDNYIGGRETDLWQSDRTFFLKIGYAWVL